MADHEDNKLILIPAWVYKAVVAAAIGAGAWMISVTVQLSTINVRIESLTRRLEDLDELERLLAAHMNDPKIHHAGISEIHRQLDELKRRMDRVEDRNRRKTAEIGVW